MKALLPTITLVAAISACNGGSKPDDVGPTGGTTGDGSGGDADGAGGASSGGTNGGGGDDAGSGGNEATGGSSDGVGGAGGSSGGVPTFDEYPSWVSDCALARTAAVCGNCLDPKCVFCTYASPQEREEHNATHESDEQCGTPDPVICSTCQSTVSGCPPCAQE